MTVPKPKDKPQIKTRSAGKADGFNNLRAPVKLNTQSDDIAEILGLAHTHPDQYQTQTSTKPVPDPDQTQTNLKTLPVSAKTEAVQTPVAPARDYNKRANSIDREALPAGAFPGASKKIYDALYLRSRGAFTPLRTIRATRREIMKWTGIRDIKTVNAHVSKLVGAGLLVRTKLTGEHEGSIYEVLLPEETSNRVVPDPDQRHTRAIPEPNRKTDSDQYQKTVRPGSGNLIDNKGTSADPKTSFKTKEENSDDDAHALSLLKVLIEAEKELTGKVSTSRERWEELGELLVAELRIAAARTTVSNVPAFLTEHLRRRLWKVDKARAAELAAAEPGQGSDAATAAVLSAEECRKCPDCGGMGFWYPEGPEKGVARCRHTKLQPVPDEAERARAE